MAVTLAERKEALENALYQGAETVRFTDGSTVTYRSVEDIRTALGLVNDAIAGDVVGLPPPRVFRISTSKGLGTGGDFW